MRRRIVIAAGAAAALAAGGTVGAVAQTATSSNYRTLIVRSGTKNTQATLGARCHPAQAPAEGDCQNVTYPLKTTGTVSLRAGERLTVLLGAAATDIRWRLARVDGTGKEQAVDVGVAFRATRTQKRWRLTLPRRLSTRIRILGFDVFYKNAYSSFEVGAKVTRTRARTR